MIKAADYESVNHDLTGDARLKRLVQSAAHR